MDSDVLANTLTFIWSIHVCMFLDEKIFTFTSLEVEVGTYNVKEHKEENVKSSRDSNPCLQYFS